MKANPAQERAIKEVYGQNIIIACPGSGKTTTLLRRISHMVSDEGIQPEEILMITFTKAAAAEMKERYEQQHQKGSAICFCTIHSLCSSLLKEFRGFDAANVLEDNFQILYDIISLDTRSESYNLQQFVKDAAMDISVFKNDMDAGDAYSPKCTNDKDFFFDIYNKYEAQKKNTGMYDYDDLLIQAYEMLRSDADCLGKCREKYGFIHVDEYQDTNFLQRDIIYLLAGQNGNITVVGDDDQSIYGFRGAKPEVMKDFLVHYPCALAIYMSTNYRSDKSIIEAASNLVQYNKKRFPKDIQAFSENEGKISVQMPATRYEMCIHAAADILKLMNSGCRCNDIAVLFRTNQQAEQMASVCLKYDIPFYGNDEIPNRYKDDMFYDICAFWHMACGKKDARSQESFVRSMTHTGRFFVDAYAFELSHKDSMNQMLKKVSAHNDADLHEIKKNLKLRHGFLMTLRFLKPCDALDVIYLQGGYEKYLKDYAVSKNISFEVLKARWDSYKDDIERMHITSFEEWISYAEKLSLKLADMQKNREGVCLSTMHKSKGLEWDNVLILNCMEGSAPFAKAVKQAEIEEERRLFYVAMTRSRHNLKLYGYRASKQNIKAKPSRFLSEAGII